MKILSAEQIREWDKYTIEQEPISSIDLMERAAMACVNWIVENVNKSYTFQLFCGQGNNGGDGLAIARLLAENGYKTSCYVLDFSSKKSTDFLINLKRLDKNYISYITCTTDIPKIQKENNIVIDALFGTGFSRSLEGIIVEIIEIINKSTSNVISIDLPSGMFSDKDNSNNICIKANDTLTFQIPKLALLLPENEKKVGQWHLLDISLDSNFIKKQESNYFYTNIVHVKKIIKTRTKFSHKGSFGHALIISGSIGMMGATQLAATACLRSGVGLTSVFSPKCGVSILQTSVPEAMVIPSYSKNYISGTIAIEKYNAIGIGPGMGIDKNTQLFFKKFLKKAKLPMVIDADALNILALNKNHLKEIPSGSILTPHPKEFERLVGVSKNDFERLQNLQNFATKYNCCVLLKGAHTAIACPDGTVHFNSTGNPGMATGGSGDVLTGILTGLLTQGYSAKNAAVLGTYLHGLTGDLAVNDIGKESFIARDYFTYIGKAFQKLNQ